MIFFSFLKKALTVIGNFRLLNLKIRFYNNGILALFTKTITLNTSQGVYKVYTRDNVIGQNLFVYGHWEGEFLSCFRLFIEKHPNLSKRNPFLLIDLGANIGISTISLFNLNLVSQSLAIEPDKENFKLLEFNIKNNNLSEKVTCLQFAVSNKKGEVLLDKDVMNYGNHIIQNDNLSKDKSIQKYSYTVSIQTDTLPNLIKQAGIEVSDQVILLWVDIQGHEGFLLEGAREWIKAHPVICVMEIWPDGIDYSEMDIQKYIDLVKSIWTHFYILKFGRFIKKPIELFDYLVKELRGVGYGENVIFLNEKDELD